MRYSGASSAVERWTIMPSGAALGRCSTACGVMVYFKAMVVFINSMTDRGSLCRLLCF